MRAAAGVGGFVFVTYLLLLGASFARAPWVTHIALPIVGNAVGTKSNGPPTLGAAVFAVPAPAITHLSGKKSPTFVATPLPRSTGAAVPGGSLIPLPQASRTPIGVAATPLPQASPTTGSVTSSVVASPPVARPAPRSSRRSGKP
jgi:hypothetical protein